MRISKTVLPFILIGMLGCNFSEKKQTTGSKKKLQNSHEQINDFCITTSEVKNNSVDYKPKNVESTFLTDSQLDELVETLSTQNLVIDSTMIYITHKSFQRSISISKKCFENQSELGLVLMKDLFVSDFIYDSINLISSTERNIFNFGMAVVIEFEIVGGSEYNAHTITLILKENSNVYEGISISSDGMRWKKKTDNSYIPMFVERVRINKQYEIPMIYYEDQFYPIGHHKIQGLWEE